MAQVAPALDSHAPELYRLLQEHLKVLRLKGYSEYTIRNRQVHIGLFLGWCGQNQIRKSEEVSLKILQQYQQFLLEYRKSNGKPLARRSRHSRLVPLRVWFRWMFRAGLIASNPAAELDLPRTILGLRDRAILEVLYSTGLRRLELRNLKLSDLHLERGIVS